MSKATVAGAVFVAILTVSIPALGGTTRHDVDPGAYVTLGSSAEYASVGRIDTSTPSGGYIGSGTLIASDWILTAGHMVDDAAALSFNIGGQVYTGSNWLAHPRWNGDLLGGYDIGLVQLSSPVNAIQPATLYTGSSEIGAVGTAVGYGMTGTGLTGAEDFDGQKRAGQNVIDAFYGRNPRKPSRLLLSDFDNPFDAGDNVYGCPLSTSSPPATAAAGSSSTSGKGCCWPASTPSSAPSTRTPIAITAISPDTPASPPSPAG